MFLDEETRQDLQIDELLSRIEPLTPMGEAAKRAFRPFMPGKEAEWQRLLDEQEQIQKQLSLHRDHIHRLETILRHVPDIAQHLRKLRNSEPPSLTEWFQIKQFLWRVHEWAKWMEFAQMPPFLHLSREEKKTAETLLWKLNPSPPLSPSFSISDAYDQRLKALRSELRMIEQSMRKKREEEAKKIEAALRVRRNRLGEWVVERGSAQDRAMAKQPGLIRVKETVYDSVYVYQDPCEKEHQRRIHRLTRQMEEMEAEISKQLAESFCPFIPMLEKFAQKLAHFDLQWARLRAAGTWQGVKPVHATDVFIINQGFHPLVAERLRETGGVVTPVQLSVRRGVTVIIGPNMGGKTVALKTIGAIAALSHYGLFVPAARCEMPLFPWVASLIGDKQNVDRGLSSFGAEAARLSEWIKRKEEGLLLLDEVGRGTNPAEGSALAQAVTRHLARMRKWTVHVTHYHEVIHIPGIKKYRVAGLNLKDCPMDGICSPGQISRRLQERMDYRLIPLTRTEPLPAQAIAIAEAFGLCPDIIQEAKKLANKKLHGRSPSARG